MDTRKQLAFNERMGKRQRYAHGGRVKRIDHFDEGGRVRKVEHFDTGGTVPGTSTTLPASTPSVISSISGSNGIGGLNAPPAQFGAQMAQGISSEFTPQNSFQASTAPTDYTNYQGALATGANNSAQGYGTEQSLQQQQQGLSNELQGVANGTGPNPAQAQLAQATGTNVANQAALMAGQRGAASNVGLLARQAAQQGAATQQQAVGQGATLESQQQLNALGAIGSQQANQQAANVAEQNANTNLYNVSAGAQNAQNANTISNYNNAQTLNAATAQNNTNAVGATESGLLGGVGSLVSSLFSKGGEVDYAPVRMAGGGEMKTATPQVSSTGRNVTGSPGGGTFSGLDPSSMMGGNSEATPMPSTSLGTTSSMGNGLGDMASNTPSGMMAAKGGNVCRGPHESHVANYLYAKGGPVPAMVSPGERYLSPRDVKQVVEQGANPLKLGTEIPGKAKVKGDSLKNDIIPRTLEDGGCVLPRHITRKKDPDKASLFVHQSIHMKKPGGK